MADLFISYARGDRSQVEALAAVLEEESLDIWWDRRLVGGDDFSVSIEQELERARVVLVAWSKTSRQSNWVKDEADFAAKAGKLIAISLDGTPPPLGFRQFHVVDFSRWQGESDSIEFAELLRATTARLGAPNEMPAVVSGRKSMSGHLADDRSPLIAVTPIKVRGNDTDLHDFAEDLADSVCSGLARFSYLNAAAQPSAEAGRKAGAAYVLESTLRRSGSVLRLSARLKTATADRQVWGENFNRLFDPEAIFDVHDDLTDHVVVAVADPYGALMRDLSAPVGMLEPEQMTPYQALLRHFIYRQRVTPEDHAIASRAVRLATERAPGNADLWAALAFCEMEEYKHTFNEEDGSFERGSRYARKAVELDPYSGYAYFALHDVSYYGQQLATARVAGKRSLELNPRDTDAMAMIGILNGFAGDWDNGMAQVNRAIELNPNGPGWYWFGNTYHHMILGDFEQALSCLRRVNMPQYFVYHATLIMLLGQLGRMHDAEQAVRDFHACWNHDLDQYRLILSRWHFAQPEIIQLLCENLRKGGLELP